MSYDAYMDEKADRAKTYTMRVTAEVFAAIAPDAEIWVKVWAEDDIDDAREVEIEEATIEEIPDWKVGELRLQVIDKGREE